MTTTARRSVYGESIDQIYASDFAYTLSFLIKEARDTGFQLKYPDGFPRVEAEKFLSQSVDLRNTDGEDGLCFRHICELLSFNKTDCQRILGLTDEGWGMQLAMIEYFENQPEDSIWKSDQIFLEVFRCYQSDVSCVYGIFKDKRNKVITVTFRGSMLPNFTTYDWRTNLTCWHTNMKTPNLVRDKMKGALKENVIVHRGYYRYIFDNKKVNGKQRYDQIQDDIKSLIKEGNPDGYKIYVAGHSLGAALSTLVAFKLAGSKKEWMPKPVTNICIASPRVGTSGFRTAFQQLEEDGLLRCLRIMNSKDTVPTLSPISFGSLKCSLSFFPRLYKHVGINIRFKKKGYEIVHPSGLGFFSSIGNTFKNSIFKPYWRILHFHSRSLHIDRLNEHKSAFSDMYIDDMYNDPEIVGPNFAERREKNQAYKLDDTQLNESQLN